MKQSSSKLIAVLLGLVITAGIIAAKAPTEGRQYDYVMVEKAGYYIYISEGDGKYEERKVKEEAKSFDHHQGPLFKVVNEFEARGYEVYANNTMGYSSSNSTTLGNFVLLRKPK